MNEKSMVPVKHKTCGNVVMWYTGPRDKSIADSNDIVYLDGSKPSFASNLPKCPHCAEQLIPHALVRCFDMEKGGEND